MLVIRYLLKSVITAIVSIEPFNIYRIPDTVQENSHHVSNDYRQSSQHSSQSHYRSKEHSRRSRDDVKRSQDSYTRPKDEYACHHSRKYRDSANFSSKNEARGDCDQDSSKQTSSLKTRYENKSYEDTKPSRHLSKNHKQDYKNSSPSTNYHRQVSPENSSSKGHTYENVPQSVKDHAYENVPQHVLSQSSVGDHDVGKKSHNQNRQYSELSRGK